MNNIITQSLRLATGGAIPLPNLAVPEVMTPESMLEIMLHTMKLTLLEYFEAAQQCLAKGQTVGATNPEFVKALNLMKRPEEIRLEKLRDLGLDGDDENHPDSLYMLAVQKFNSDESYGVKPKVERINKKMSSVLTELVTGKVNIDNIVEKKMEIERFVNDFFDENQEEETTEEMNPLDSGAIIEEEEVEEEEETGVIKREEEVVEEEQVNLGEEDEPIVQNVEQEEQELKEGDNLGEDVGVAIVDENNGDVVEEARNEGDGEGEVVEDGEVQENKVEGDN